MPITERPSDEFIALLRKSGDADINIAMAAQREFAKALELPLRKGVLVGNILGNIFETINVEAGSTTEFPLDLISPGLEGEHVAYTNPGHGRIPERSVEGDYVMIPTYTIASSVDYCPRSQMGYRRSRHAGYGSRFHQEDERRWLAHNSSRWR
jgi:hypothetical protein